MWDSIVDAAGNLLQSTAASDKITPKNDILERGTTMEENKELLDLLKEIKEANRKQTLYSQITCIAAIVAAMCFVGIFILVKDFLPQINQILTEITKIIGEIPGIVAQMEDVLANLQAVTAKLTAVDFGGLVEGVDSLVASGQAGLEQTVEKLNSIDFESLNKAIKNLEAVVEPMAKFFKVFK